MRQRSTLLALLILAAVPAAADAKVFASDCGTARQKPRSFVLYCGDAGQYLTKLRWTSWGGRVARASGVLSTKTCDPNCAAGGVTSEAVRVRFFYPHSCPGRTGRSYRYLTIEHRDGDRERRRLPCPY